MVAKGVGIETAKYAKHAKGKYRMNRRGWESGVDVQVSAPVFSKLTARTNNNESDTYFSVRTYLWAYFSR